MNELKGNENFFYKYRLKRIIKYININNGIKIKIWRLSKNGGNGQNA